MLEGHALLTALSLHIDKLRIAINKPDVIVTQVCGADLYYTDGGAVGSFMKLYPLNFYYDMSGKPHYGCSGPLYDLYGAACNQWIMHVANGDYTISSVFV